MIGQFILLGGILPVFYFFMIRPQHKMASIITQSVSVSNSGMSYFEVIWKMSFLSSNFWNSMQQSIVAIPFTNGTT